MAPFMDLLGKSGSRSFSTIVKPLPSFSTSTGRGIFTPADAAFSQESKYTHSVRGSAITATLGFQIGVLHRMEQ
eukprot:1156977-Pelagomonas_calceolata.AAC.1